jgi:hypothetical protein
MPDHADADAIILVSVDDHLVDLATAVSEVLDAAARALFLAAELPVFDLLTSPSV